MLVSLADAEPTLHRHLKNSSDYLSLRDSYPRFAEGVELKLGKLRVRFEDGNFHLDHSENQGRQHPFLVYCTLFALVLQDFDLVNIFCPEERVDLVPYWPEFYGLRPELLLKLYSAKKTLEFQLVGPIESLARDAINESGLEKKLRANEGHFRQLEARLEKAAAANKALRENARKAREDSRKEIASLQEQAEHF